MQSYRTVLLLAALSCGAARAAPAPSGDALAGKAAFYKCASCHQVGASARGGFGPQLNGIVGRPAAITKDFPYSAALKNSRLVWTDANLAAFLRGPSDLVPGTKMRFWGISDERQIANLLAYLRTLPAYAEAPR